MRSKELFLKILRTEQLSRLVLVRKVVMKMTEKKMAREKSEINEQDVCKADEYGELNVVNIRLVKEPSIISDEPVRCSDDASRLIRELLSGFDREVFAILNLASDGKPINMNVVSIGTLNASLVSPREVFKSSILSNAACFIAYHCHPSGNPKPSLEDFEATQRLREAGAILDIKMADHIIVACGRDKTFSFASNNYLEGNGKDNYQNFKNRESWER